MLGTDVVLALNSEGLEAIPTYHSTGESHLDITDQPAVYKALREHRPDAVINCAAFTHVDGAESNPDAAFRVNAFGSMVVANACAEYDIPLCAISTDFVFDGAKEGLYTEFDQPNPRGVYASSKYAGENCIREVWRKHWIVRSSWLFGLHGPCFPNSILKAAQTKPELPVVADQRGTPTYTADLAQALIMLIRSPFYGTYHIANTGVTTWYEFACCAVKMAGLKNKVIPITAEQWLSPTPRPVNSALRPYVLELQGRPLLRPWEEALAEYISKRRDALNRP
jgi:dTDP-4-dehydrorhamnose reductase